MALANAETIHAPSFWPDVIPTMKDDQKKLQKQLEAQFDTNADWLPELLLQEIQSYVPSDDDIDQQNDGQRNPEAFSKKISEFFKVGRIFLNYKQLASAVQYLFNAWAVSSSHGAKSLTCFYGPPSKKGKQPIDQKRQPIISPKEIRCPCRVSLYFLKLLMYSTRMCCSHLSSS